MLRRLRCNNVELLGKISFCIEGGSSETAKQLVMHTTLKMTEVDCGKILYAKSH